MSTTSQRAVKLGRAGLWVAGWLCLALAGPAAADDAPADPPGLPDAAPVEAAPPDAPPAADLLPDRRATVQRFSVERVDAEGRLRLNFFLSYPKATGLDQRFEQPGAYRVTLANAVPADDLPWLLPVARESVAEVLVHRVNDGAPGGVPSTRIEVRLNAPVECVAYLVPSEKKLVIDCAFRATPPTMPEGDDAAAGNGDGPGDGAGDRITLRFVDAPVSLVVEALLEQIGANIIVQPDVATRTGATVSLTDVTVDQALDAIAVAYNLLWLRRPGDIYIIGSPESLGATPVDLPAPLPDGWLPEQAVAAVAAAVPEVQAIWVPDSPTGDATAVALRLRGELRHVFAARQWLVAAPPYAPSAPPDNRMLPTERALVVLPGLRAEDVLKLAETYGVIATVLPAGDGPLIVSLVGQPEGIAVFRELEQRLSQVRGPSPGPSPGQGFDPSRFSPRGPNPAGPPPLPPTPDPAPAP